MKTDRFLRIEEDGIVFKTTVDTNGVQTLLESTVSRLREILSIVGQSDSRVSYAEGNFNETTFVVDPSFTKEEIEIFKRKL